MRIPIKPVIKKEWAKMFIELLVKIGTILQCRIENVIENNGSYIENIIPFDTDKF